MLITNDHVGPVHVTRHALDRWEERGRQGELLADWLKVAVPFGGQRGTDRFLAHEDCVFVIRSEEGGGRIVATVLTRDMAMAGMQAFTPQCCRRPSAAQPAPPRPFFAGGLVREADPERAKGWKPKKQHRMRNDTSVTSLRRVYGATDEQLNALAIPADSVLACVIEHERSQRRKLAKYKAHANRMECGRQAMKVVLLALLPEAQLPTVWQMVEEAEQKLGGRS